MRLDFLVPLLLVAAVACGGDDDDGGGGGDDGDTADAGSETDAGETPDDAGSPDAAPEEDGGPTGADCGGIATLMCEDTQFCDYANDSCGATDETGKCMPRPSSCDAEGPPVCGCDGQRYESECLANRAGTDVSQVSDCRPSASP
jgi:Kazal-type serine protease inhibitor domain